MSKRELTKVQQTLEIKQTEVEIAKATNQLKLFESFDRDESHWHNVGPTGYQLSGTDPLFSQSYPPPAIPYTSLSDRSDGRFLPYYDNEHDQRRLRARARALSAFSSVTIGAMESMKNYVIGSGVTLEVQPVTSNKQQTATIAQRILDETLGRNDVCGRLDAEIHSTSREDGDCFVALYPTDDNTEIDLEINDAESCQEPHGFERQLEEFLGISHKLNAWHYGIHTQWSHVKKRMDCRALGYFFQHSEGGDDWDYLPSSRLEHFKRNVPMAAPRGISDYAPVDADVDGEEKLRRATATGATINAGIAFIRQWSEGTTKDEVESVLAGKSVGTRTDQAGKVSQVERFKPGTIPNIPKGMEYKASPMGALRSPMFIEVAQYMLRSIGLRWTFPEYMISGDASNANFASTLVAESPFVKARESDQGFFSRGMKRLSWKILKMAHDMGKFGNITWEQLYSSVTISATFPEVASRDRLKIAQANAIQHQAGILSLRTWAAESDRDYDEELVNRAEEPTPVALSVPAGAPGGGAVLGGRPSFPEQIHEASAGLWRGYP